MEGTDRRERVPGTRPEENEDPESVPPEPPVPPAATRYLERSTTPSARALTGVRVHSRGMVRLGRAWWPYRGHEVTVPNHGYLRVLRVAGLLRIVDSLVEGRARRHTRVWGRAVRPDLIGPDLVRGDRAHAAISAMWVPPALTPSSEVHWTAEGPRAASVAFSVGGAPVSLRLALHPGGLPLRVSTQRWGDPERTGFFRELPFDARVLEHRTFAGLTVPSTGVLGWRTGRPGAVREVLRFQLTGLEPWAVPPTVESLTELTDSTDDEMD